MAFVGTNGDDSPSSTETFQFGLEGNDILNPADDLYHYLDGGPGSDTLFGKAVGDDLYGGTFDDTIFGGAGSDFIYGGEGADDVSGGEDGDYIEGGQGVDEISGGIGNDTIYGGSDNDTIEAGGGDDLIDGGANFDSLFGGDGADKLYGGDNDDSLNGGAGADRMIGGDGSDGYDVDNAGDVTLEYAGGGSSDAVVTAISHTLSANIENLFQTGLAAINGTGNGAANSIVGNNAKNVLSGLGGNDTIRGAGGNDTVRGGTGKDILTGEAGRDFFDFNSKSESVKGSNRDVITDLKRADDDRIDLRSIDADTSANSGNDSFKFISKDAFKGGGGELRYTDHGSVCTVQGDINGDKVADFEIRVNIGSLQSGDFFL